MITALEVEDDDIVFHWHLLVTFTCPAFGSVAVYRIVIRRFWQISGETQGGEIMHCFPGERSHAYDNDNEG